MKKKLFSCILTCLALCACNTPTASNNNIANDIIGEWCIIEAMGISTEAADTKPFIHFTDSGTIDGHTSVNTFFGQYTVNEDSIFFDQVGSTMRMGEDMEIEVAVMEALGMCTTLDVQDSAIYASDIFGNNVMVLKRR